MAVGEIDSEGHLELRGDPEAWIKRNPASRLSSVTSLKVYFYSGEEIGESIGELTHLIRLEFDCCKSLKCLPDTITRLRYLKHLQFHCCYSLEELPANIGQLVSLTHFQLSGCHPNSIANLPNFTSLALKSCKSLVGLPVIIGQLVSLTHLELSFCDNINSLLTSVVDLPNLTSLSLQSCDYSFVIPSNLGHLKKTLTHSSLSHRGWEELPASLCQLGSLTALTHLYLCNIKLIYKSIANLSNLTSLSLSLQSLRNSLVELPYLDGLANLCILDIQYSRIKFLPWSIMKLRKLRHLMLPYDFRLETLPYELNNSVIISVENMYVRKSWEELKKEMPQLSIQIVGEIPNNSIQNPSIIYPPGYLRLNGDPSQWIINNTNLLNFVRVLDLEHVEELTDSITLFSELTHLYLILFIDNKVDICLPDDYFVTLTRLRHLSLEFNEIGDVFIFHSLSKLSNLKSLHIGLLDIEITEYINMPNSLNHLSLSYCKIISPLIDSLEKLTNLKTLDLYECDHCNSLPNLNLDKLKIFNCFFESHSINCLRHLEVLLNHQFDYDCWGFLNQLVNLETLSITSFNMESLPEEISRLRTLQILQLKDCVNLRELPSNLHELVNLHTLDISITRIKSLPLSFMKSCNLQHLILPKCFNLKSLPRNLKQVSVIDDTEDTYYKSMYYDASLYQTSAATSDESKYKEAEQCVVPGVSCNAGNDNVPLARINENVLAEQTSADHFMGDPEHFTSEQGGVSQMYKASKDPVGENSQQTAFSSQNQFTPLGNGESMTNLPGTSSFGLNDQYILYDGQMGSMTFANAHGIAPISQHISSCDGNNFIGGLNNHALKSVHNNINSQSYDANAVRQEKEITSEAILEQLPTNMGLIDAADKLDNLTENNSPKEMPDNIKVMNRRLKYYCSMQSPPGGLEKSENLNISLCVCSKELLAKLKDSMSLQYLAIEDCSQHRVNRFPTNFSELVNLKTLPIRCNYIKSLPSFAGLSSLLKLYVGGVSSLDPTPRLEKLPADLDKLDRLLVVDIHDTKIKSLPWSIKKLQKLRFLFLPLDFRLETLPSQLIESVVITVDSMHIRKTWKELKTELGKLPFYGVGVEAQSFSTISPSRYLQLKEDPGLWIMENYDLCLSVLSLELELRDNMLKKGDSLRELQNLTYLYISGNNCLNLKHLPDTSMTLRHLSLQHCNIECLSDSLGKLSNLESLCLDLGDTNLPYNLDMLVNLRHLSLHHGKEQSDFGNITKLSNLKALDLFQCELESLPENLNLAELKLSGSNITSLPTSLRRLEILHDKETCNSTECDVTSLNLEQLINIEKLSVTCYSMKSLPSIERLQNLQELQLKDCFSLESLPNNLGGLVKLCTLDISGTRIKSLPDSITSKLQNLKNLILPKCFQQDGIRKYPRKEFTKVSIDEIVELYFKDTSDDDDGYETSMETSNEGNGIELDSIEGSNISNAQQPHRIHVTPIIGERLGISSIQTDQNNITTMETEQANGENNRHASQNGKGKNQILQNDMKGGKRKEISLETLQSFWSKNMTLDDSAKEIGVSRSTLKRRLKDLKLVWPSSKNERQHLDAKKRKYNSKAPFESDSPLQKLVNPGNSTANAETVGECIMLPNHVSSNSNVAGNLALNTTMVTIREDLLDAQGDMDSQCAEEHLDGALHSTESHMDIQQQVQEPLNGALHTTESSGTIVVKATYKEISVRIVFSLSWMIDRLIEEVGMKFKLEVNKYRLLYQDEDKEWMMLTCVDDLKYALNVAESLGTKFVRLSVIDYVG